jgi:CRP-like cAMP-binding protein
MPAAPAPTDTQARIQQGLRRCALFAAWPDLVIDRIARIARLAHYPRGAEVLPKDRLRRELKVVVSGYLAVSGVNAGGTKFMLTLIGPGEIVGLVRLLKQGGRLYDYQAHQDTVLIHLQSDALEAVLDQTPALWKDVAFMTMERQRDSIIAMQRSALGGVSQRVAEILVQVARVTGERGEGRALHLRVSQSDLAHMVSVSRQTINKELGLLARQGIVRAAYGQLTILDMPALRRIAEVR